MFRHCLFSNHKVVRTMTQLRSHCHQIVVNEIDKVAVTSIDDKRFLLDNGVSSLAYGHYKIGSTFSDTTDRQTGRCFKMVALHWFLQTQSLGNSSHFFFCLEYSNGNDSSSVYSDSTFFTSSSSSSTADLDSESSNYSETTESRGFPHDMLRTLPSSRKLWQKQKFSLRKVKRLQQLHFHWFLNTYGNVCVFLFYPFVKVNAFYFSVVHILVSTSLLYWANCPTFLTGINHLQWLMIMMTLPVQAQYVPSLTGKPKRKR